jgi:hypothetical protein
MTTGKQIVALSAIAKSERKTKKPLWIAGL